MRVAIVLDVMARTACEGMWSGSSGIDHNGMRDIHRTDEELHARAAQAGGDVPNAIGSINASLRQVTRKRRAFPNPDSARKVLYLAILKVSERWARPIKDWPAALALHPTPPMNVGYQESGTCLANLPCLVLLNEQQ
jgi:mutator family transposase